jgi:hypothetical protein
MICLNDSPTSKTIWTAPSHAATEQTKSTIEAGERGARGEQNVMLKPNRCPQNPSLQSCCSLENVDVFFPVSLPSLSLLFARLSLLFEAKAST